MTRSNHTGVLRLVAAAWPWAAAAATGLLLALAFPPFSQESAAWIALAPLLSALWFGGARGGVHLRPFLLGWAAGLVFFLITFHWITTVSVVGWVAIAPYLALYPALWAWMCGTALAPRENADYLAATANGTRPNGANLSFVSDAACSVGRVGQSASRPPSADTADSTGLKLAPFGTRPALAPIILPGLAGQPAPAAPGVPRSSWMDSRRNLLLSVAVAAAWVAQEWLRSVMFTGFGWNALGVAFNNNLAFAQSASVTGADGLSFLAAFASSIAVVTVRRLWHEIGKVALRPHYDFNLAMALVVAVFAWGVHRLQRPVAEREIRAVLVQPAIPQSQKWDPAAEGDILSTLEVLSAGAEASRPELLLWPEAATPRPALLDAATLAWTDAIRERTGADFLFGTLDGDETADYNAAVLLSAGREPQLYRKLHLVPFGEYIPFRHSFPLFAWIAGDLVPGDFRPGAAGVVFESARANAKIGPLICFEDTLPDIPRRAVLAGADLLANVTNDGWFGRSPAAEQHLANARLRAVENARPLVRAANTGVTCVIDARGRMVASLRDGGGRPFAAGTLTVTIPLPREPERTLFTRLGRWFALACCGLSAAVLVAYGVRRRRARGASAHA